MRRARSGDPGGMEAFPQFLSDEGGFGPCCFILLAACPWVGHCKTGLFYPRLIHILSVFYQYFVHILSVFYPCFCMYFMHVL